MNAERWQAIGDLFERALPLPPGQRTALVEQVCGADDELRREVFSLLASHLAAPGGFVQEQIKNAVTSFYEASLLGSQPVRVGPYRLVRELGRGGMGTVFLAERDDDQYHARVAIKLVRPGMDTEFILGRFRRERQTLARLQHPNVSRLLDGGTTEHGLPYIVMEYIDGPWLTQFAAERRLTVTDRLRIFMDVCSAVDYAHRNFIIHRDLKPGNILVGRDGVPKLVDFGICKLLRADVVSGQETIMTPLTPNYASPEQVQGGPITLLSDVYSLGVVLYELLTGKCPRRFEKLSAHEVDQAFQTPIVRPSAAAEDTLAARQLSGDLDNVLMRALETEPERRYESAAQLAEDVRRYLDHEPVRARPRTLRYRTLKFVRRNSVAVAAAASVLAALTVGLVVSVYEARIADARLQQIRTLADKLVFDVHDAVRNLPGSTQARQVIVQTALEFLDSTANSAKGDARSEKELAKAYRRLGDVQGNVQSSNLGDPASALVRYRRAIGLLDDAIRHTPNDLDALTERLVLDRRVGTLQASTGQLRDAVQMFGEGIRRGRPFAASSASELRAALADLYIESSEAKRNMNDYRAALQDATEGLRLYRDVAAIRRSDPAVRQALSNAYAAVGMAESRLGLIQDGLTHFRQGAEELETLVGSDRQNVTWNRELMLAYGHIADALGNPGLQNLGDRAGALDAYRRAAEIGKRLHEADRADQRAAADYGIALSRVETVMDDRDFAAKAAVQRESLRVLDEAAAINPDNVSLRIYRALVLQHLGDSLTAEADLEGAREAYVKSAATAEAGINSGHAVLVTIFIQSNQKLALNAVASARRSDALDLAQRALRAGENGPPRSLPRGLAAMGLTYAALLRSPLRQPGDREQAVSWLGKSLDAWRASQSEPGFASPHQREMREVEEMLARIR